MAQADKILHYLKKRPNKWVPMPLLARISHAYAVHSRVSDLRDEGHDIRNKTVYDDGHRKSYYKFIAPVHTEQDGQTVLFKPRFQGAFSQ